MGRMLLIVKGLVVGGTMLIPGVSGGSMAMVLGIYDELIACIGSFWSHRKRSLYILTPFLFGAIAGILLLARPLGSLLDQYPMPLMYFFMGAVTGSIPLLLRKAQLPGNREPDAPEPGGRGVLRYLIWALYLAAGILAVLLLDLLPDGLLSLQPYSPSYYLLLLLAGFVAAIALILPGISVSHMFLMLGLYRPVLSMLRDGPTAQWLSLIPLAIGLLAGVLLTARLLERAMLRHPAPTYLVILGFLLGSIFSVFPGRPSGWDIPLCLLLFAAGFLIIYLLSKLEANQAAKRDTPVHAGY